MMTIRKGQNFSKFLNDFIKFCYNNYYLVEDGTETKKDIENRILNFLRRPFNNKIDIISVYLLRHYHTEYNRYINKNGNLVKKFINSKKEIPPYIFNFEDFYINLQIIYR